MDVGSIILQQLISKVIVDRTRIPRSAYDQVEPLVTEFKTWGKTLDDFSIEEPVTWGKTAWRVIENMIEERQVVDTDPIKEYLEKTGYTRELPGSVYWIGDWLMLQIDREKVEENGDRQLCIIRLSNGSHIFVKLGGEEYDLESIYLPADEAKYEFCCEGIREIFWAHQDHVFVENDNDEYVASKHEFNRGEYKGSALAEIKTLRDFASRGIRRVVILQGVPGTGKTTLCAHAARLLSSRTLVLSNKLISHISRNEWEAIIKVIKPEMVIIDDIDRANRHNLEQSLYMFEDTYYDVPMTLLTTNDQSKLPDAFRRPGRIDMIIEMPKPSSDIRTEMIQDFAKDAGITEEIPAWNLLLLDKMVAGWPGAYAKELLRRYKVLGWDYRVLDNDITFAPIMKKIRTEIKGESLEEIG